VLIKAEKWVSGGRFQVSGVRGQKCGCLGALCGPRDDGSLPAPTFSPERASGNKSPQRGRLHTESSGSLGRGCYFSTLDFRLLDFEKVNELSVYVYENKGPAFSKSGESWNVTENKGSYVFESGNVVENTGSWFLIGGFS